MKNNDFFTIKTALGALLPPAMKVFEDFWVSKCSKGWSKDFCRAHVKVYILQKKHTAGLI